MAPESSKACPYLSLPLSSIFEDGLRDYYCRLEDKEMQLQMG